MNLKDISDLVICSDLHIYDWPDNNKELRRTIALLNWFENLVVDAHENGKTVIMCGDLFHDPLHISNTLLELVQDHFNRINRKVKANTVLAITGNHDRNGDDWKNSASWIRTFSRQYDFIHCLDFQVWPVKDKYVICGIPYIRGNVGIRNASERLLHIANNQYVGKVKILVIHTDLPGALDTNGMEIKSHENISPKVSQFFSGWDWVFSGHIHKPMAIRDNIVMVGSPMHTRVIDMGCIMGYWTMKGGNMKLISSGLPEYRYEGDEDGGPDDVYIKKVIHRVSQNRESKKTKEKKEINLSNWDNLIDEYIRHKGYKGRKKIGTAKGIINSINK